MQLAQSVTHELEAIIYLLLASAALLCQKSITLILLIDLRITSLSITHSQYDAIVLGAGLSGLALEVTVSCKKESFTENTLFTHGVFSGLVMLQISNYWQDGDNIDIDLLPYIDARH